MPIYNSGKTVKKIIGQVLSQGEQNVELILIDDGSTDDSPKIIDEIAKSDERVKTITQQNTGPAGARNAGIKKASGKYIMFLDSDDDIDPSLIEKMSATAQNNGLDMVICGWYEVSATGKKPLNFPATTIDSREQDLREYVVHSLGENGLFYGIWNKIYRSDVIKKNMLAFRNDLNFGEDLVFNLDYLQHINRIGIINESLYYYSVDSTGSVFAESSTDYSMRIKNNQELDKFIGLPASVKLADLAIWVKIKWFVQYALTTLRSSKDKEEQNEQIKYALSKQELSPLSKRASLKKRLIVNSMIELQRCPRFFILMLRVIVKLKS